MIEILYDHYKETFALSKEAQSRRNKSFILLCILEAISFLFLIRPERALELIVNGINSEMNTTLQLSNTIIQTSIWVLIAYIMIRYIQDMLYIERQYVYLDKLEKEISKSVNIFNREGENYQNNYPIVLNIIDLFYKILMPIFFTLINIIKIVNEWILINNITIAIICDTVLAITIFIITWFYFFEINSQLTIFCKKNIPFINQLSNILRNVLKKV